MKRLLFVIVLYSTLFAQTFTSTQSPLAELFLLSAAVCILFLFIWSVFIKFRNKSSVIPEIRCLALMIFLATIFFLIFNAFDLPFLLEDVRELAIPFMALFSSQVLYDTKNDVFYKDLTLFCLIAAACSIYVIMNTGGMVILDSYREDSIKNQIAPLFSQISLITLCLLLIRENKLIIKILLLFAFIALILLPIFLQSRTSQLSLLAGVVVLLLIKYKYKAMLIIVSIALLVIFFFGDSFTEFVIDAFTANRDITDADQLSSGRVTRVFDAFRRISENILGGAMCNPEEAYFVFSEAYPIVHNYLLLKLVRYGLVFSFPFVASFICVCRLFIKALKSMSFISIACILVAIITSIAEYSAPFGPGTSFVICYIIAGRSLTPSYDLTKIKKNCVKN